MRKFVPWLLLAGIIAVIFGTIYATAQQALRLTANDPQIQIAEDIANELNQGTVPTSFLVGTIDASKSLAPFVIIYDKSGKAITGSGRLHGKLLAMPLGVLKHADGKSYNFVTWQPEKGVRLAAVAVSADKYYVVSARSLAEVEKRENKIFWLSVAGWLVSLGLLIGMYIFQARARTHRSHA